VVLNLKLEICGCDSFSHLSLSSSKNYRCVLPCPVYSSVFLLMDIFLTFL
jgi:hypothetical protein